MGNNNWNEEEDDHDCFSDAREEVSSVSDYNSDDFSCCLDQETTDLDLWTNNPESITNRRDKFFQSMGFSFKKRDFVVDSLPLDHIPPSQHLDSVSELPTASSGDYEEEKLVRNESMSSSLDDGASQSDQSSLSEAFSFRGSFKDRDRVKNMDDQIWLRRDYSSNSSTITEGLSESGSSRSGSYRETYVDSPKKSAKGWLKKLGVLTHVLDKQEECIDAESVGSTTRRHVTRVQSFKKQFKELSSLSVAQEFSAHDGSIVVMKFSPDGNYLASAGEDCVVRVWNITEDERRDKFEVPESDAGSCVYFEMNEHSQIEPLKTENDHKVEKSRGLLRKKTESTCAVLPPKVFSISETPKHEFRGHAGEILDVSWSEKGFLLSSSVDETVRLWRVGCDECIRVFSHKSFVTCVAFNPVDENYFMSGSTDGIVRVWDVSQSRVVDYTDIREIVTALCYRSDAKGAAVGSMTGDCRFYHILDNELQLDREINLNGKKKVPSKRITGFQFFPGDSDKVMVTSADSQIRIISGVDTICKLRASRLRTTLSPTAASFTSDGKHIVSTIEDSGIHVWDYSQPTKKSSSSNKPKTIRSYEGFLSDNVSVAIPWLGQGKEESFSSFIADLDKRFARFPAMECFPQTKGATTWPEEKLQVVGAGAAAAAITATVSSRSKLRLLKSVCQNICASLPHLWGLVIVTATWDGRMRVFHNYGLPIRV